MNHASHKAREWGSVDGKIVVFDVKLSHNKLGSFDQIDRALSSVHVPTLQRLHLDVGFCGFKDHHAAELKFPEGTSTLRECTLDLRYNQLTGDGIDCVIDKLPRRGLNTLEVFMFHDDIGDGALE